MANEMLQVLQSQIGLEELPNFSPPFTKWLQPVLLEAKEDSMTLKVKVRKEMTNAMGLLHGGIHAALLDEVIGMTVMVLDKPELSVTINLTIDYLGKAYEGETVICKSQLVRQGKTILHFTGEIRNEAGKLLSKATSNLLNFPMGAKK